jgi:hypothetical protein
MPKGVDRIRTLYFNAKEDHPNRKRSVYTGFEGNNHASTRTYYSDISTDVVYLSKKLCHFAALLQALNPIYLEDVSREIGYPVSNYTIAGLLNQQWGVRHNPTKKTKIAIGKLTEWLERTARKLKVWKRFQFSYHPKHIQQEEVVPLQQHKPIYENQIKSFWKASRQKVRRKEVSRKKGICRVSFGRYAPVSHRSK